MKRNLLWCICLTITREKKKYFYTTGPSGLVSSLILLFFLGLFLPLAQAENQPLNLSNEDINKLSVPFGELAHAKSNGDLISILYYKEELIYYREFNISESSWGIEYQIGEGTQARLFIDLNGNPHIAYVATDVGTYNVIGYLHLISVEEGWSEAVFIGSNGLAHCSSPDISIDSQGFAHITYTDPRGNSAGYNDIMYAHNQNGNFLTVVYKQGSFISDSWMNTGDYYNKGSFITLDSNNFRYLFYHHQSHMRFKGTSPETINTYYAKIDHQDGTSILTNPTTSIVDIYDITIREGFLFSLYRNNNIRVSKSTYTDGVISATTEIASPELTTASAFDTDGVDVIIAGTSGNFLQVYRNNDLLDLTPTEVTGNNLAVVYNNQQFYILYTPVMQNVTFNGNQGTPGTQSMETEKGTLLSEQPQNPTLAGHNFVKWNTQTDGLGDDFDMEIPIMADVTYFAIWEEIITYDLNILFDETRGVVTINNQPVSNQEVLETEEEALLTLTASPLAGYRFVNWNATSGLLETSTNTTTTFTMPNAAVNITANFEIIPTYPVTFTEANEQVGTNIVIYEDEEKTIVVEEALAINEAGTASIELPDNQYWFTATLPDHEVYNGSFFVDGDQTSINFEMIAIPAEVTITFEVLNGNGNLEAKMNEVLVSSGTIVLEGNNIVFTATPETGFGIKSWEINGQNQELFLESTLAISVGNVNIHVVVEFEEDLSTTIINAKSADAFIYPNPARDMIFITHQGRIEMIEILDFNGRLKKKIQTNESLDYITISDLTPGMYILRIAKEDKVVISKFQVIP